MFSFLKQIFGTAQGRTIARYERIVAEINRKEAELGSLSDDELRAKTKEFKERIQKGETLDDLLVEAYAVVKNACRRMIGNEFHVSGYNQRWDMIPFDVQLIGAIALHKGYIAEMQTGEGKTITAVMPLYLNALSGKPVHIVTANDYLANRDSEWVGTVLRWLGLTTGVIVQDFPYDQRGPIYQCDVVYGTASEFGFDYLRDNSVAHRKEEQVQRGYSFALIDEVDSILIDEARTPLIISGPSGESKQLYDVLRDSVARLVEKQKESCTRLALDAKKILEPYLHEDENLAEGAVRHFSEKEKQAFRMLWLVNKGTPRLKALKRLREDPDFRAEIDNWDLYFYAEQNKDERAKTLAELYIIVDEKANEYELTDRGIEAWKECGGKEDDFVMLDLGYEFAKIDGDPDLSTEQKMERKLKIQEEDAVRKERAHNLRQLLRAHLLMEKDVDYIVQENKVIIIDENTGRPQPGRRFSDGLHQAIEAKELVPIQRETQTYATITIQNYFRMYSKLAGMTGTAITEAHEFKEIYKLDVLQIPTNMPCVRTDANDEMYMTEREKYNAILKAVKEIHGAGRPILLGTESVEVSEKLSRIFKLNRLEHTILNAKNHAREAEIIANAGQRGAITISTNMAGRGTDIKLGEGIASIGGLQVIGSTRHQARRIDRQLRGRSGRQGDPGASKFFISLEDPLMRLFASPSLTSLLQRFRPPEGEPISAPILNRSIETAQKRIEQRNYTIRKHTLEYDDVMNKQRQEIYAFRGELLAAEKPIDLAREVLWNLTHTSAEAFFRSREKEGGWDPEGFRLLLLHHFPVTFAPGFFDDDHSETKELGEKAFNRIFEAFGEKISLEGKKAILISRESNFNPEPLISNAVRSIMVHTIDHLWQEHLLAMDHLRSDVHLRAVGQKDPLMEFKHEAFLLFEQFTQHLRIEMAKALFRFEIVPTPELEMQQFLQQLQLERDRSLVSELEKAAPNGQTPVPPPVAPITVAPKVGRNDPCPCGSGKKYKKCCGQHAEDSSHEDNPPEGQA
jgi:preprotein translocase subunit SecA